MPVRTRRHFMGSGRHFFAACGFTLQTALRAGSDFGSELRNEIFLKIANLQWILQFSLLLLALKGEPVGDTHAVRRVQWSDYCAMAILGLTGPFSLLFLPVIVWKWYRSRSSFSRNLLGIALVTGTIQFFCILVTSPPSEAGRAVPFVEMLSGIVGIGWSAIFFGTRHRTAFRFRCTLCLLYRSAAYFRSKDSKRK